MGKKGRRVVFSIISMSCMILAVLVLNLKSAEARGRVYKDIPYGKFQRAQAKRLDIYAPARANNLPVMVYVHGGGWRIGDKSRVHTKPEFFNDMGYLFVSVNYRLVPDISFPANAYDVAEAFAWIKRNIYKFGGDGKKLFAMGHSAGAHLVTLISVDNKYLKKHGLSNKIIKGTVCNDTAALDIPSRMAEQGPIGTAIFLYAFTSDRQVWEEASPINFIKSGNTIPTMLLLVSGSDSNKLEINFSFAAELSAKGVEASVVRSPSDSHKEINHSVGEPGRVSTIAIKRFLNSF